MNIPKEIMCIIEEFADDTIFLRKQRVIQEIKEKKDVILDAAYRSYELPVTGINITDPLYFYFKCHQWDIWCRMLETLMTESKVVITDEMLLKAGKYSRNK